MIRLLSYENKGYWLMTKRLSKEKFTSWPKNEQSITVLQAWELRKLLCSQLSENNEKKS